MSPKEKWCPKGKHFASKDEFYHRAGGGLSGWCRGCARLAAAEANATNSLAKKVGPDKLAQFLNVMKDKEVEDEVVTKPQLGVRVLMPWPPCQLDWLTPIYAHKERPIVDHEGNILNADRFRTVTEVSPDGA